MGYVLFAVFCVTATLVLGMMVGARWTLLSIIEQIDENGVYEERLNGETLYLTLAEDN